MRGDDEVARRVDPLQVPPAVASGAATGSRRAGRGLAAALSHRARNLLSGEQYRQHLAIKKQRARERRAAASATPADRSQRRRLLRAAVSAWSKASSSSCCALPKNARPAAVSLTPPERRTKRRASTSRSTRMICLLTVGWDMNSCRPAAVRHLAGPPLRKFGALSCSTAHLPHCPVPAEARGSNPVERVLVARGSTGSRTGRWDQDTPGNSLLIQVRRSSRPRHAEASPAHTVARAYSGAPTGCGALSERAFTGKPLSHHQRLPRGRSRAASRRVCSGSGRFSDNEITAPGAGPVRQLQLSGRHRERRSAGPGALLAACRACAGASHNPEAPGHRLDQEGPVEGPPDPDHGSPTKMILPEAALRGVSAGHGLSGTVGSGVPGGMAALRRSRALVAGGGGWSSLA